MSTYISYSKTTLWSNDPNAHNHASGIDFGSDTRERSFYNVAIGIAQIRTINTKHADFGSSAIRI